MYLVWESTAGSVICNRTSNQANYININYDSKVNIPEEKHVQQPLVITSPVSGKCMPLSGVPDDTFAACFITITPVIVTTSENFTWEVDCLVFGTQSEQIKDDIHKLMKE
jgi:hypothetical protein